MKKTISLFFVAILVFGAFSTIETKAQSTDTQKTLDLIASLTKQIQELQAKITSLRQERQEKAASLALNLKEGSRGESVKTLQAILAADSDVYPEGLITGVYGKLTAKAVARFQRKQGLPQVGVVGPKTLEKLNRELEKTPVALEATGASGEKQPCAKVPPGHLIAPGWLRKQGGVAPIVPPCQTLPPGIAIKLGQSSSTPTSTIGFALSNITSLVGSNTAVVKWNTNRPAKGQVFYGTATSSYTSSTPLNVNFLTNHFHNISGLAPQTTYHFQVWSEDASGTVATSSDHLFITSPLADTTLPVISSTTVTNVSSTSATINWTTNELTLGKVMYGTSTLSSNASSTATSLSALHSANLTGLAASTTYQFAIEATDAFGNKSTSSQQSFTTTQ